MSANYDLNTDVGKVRLEIDDTQVNEPDRTLFSDEEIQVWLDREGSVELAAADALERIATSEALIGKRIKTLDLQTDGPAVAAALREHAQILRDRAATTDTDGDGSYGFAVAQFDPSDPPLIS